MRMLSIAPVRRELVHGGQEISLRGSISSSPRAWRSTDYLSSSIHFRRDGQRGRNPDVELENRRTLDATALAIVARTSGGSALACEHQITRCRRREGRNRLVSIGFRAPLAGIRC